MNSAVRRRLRSAPGRVLVFVFLAHCAACRHSHPVLPGETVRRAKIADPKDLEAAGFPAKAGTPLYEWTGGQHAGPLRITIDLSEQRATIRRGKETIGWTYVATGKSGHGTKTGNFHVTEKVKDKVSTSWGRIVNSSGAVVVSDAKAGRDGGGRFVGAPMPCWMRVYGAVGMHAGPIPNPGSPASHGCIRLPRSFAETLFDIVQIGTPVSIIP